jgi:hypothetical protein
MEEQRGDWRTDDEKRDERYEHVPMMSTGRNARTMRDSCRTGRVHKNTVTYNVDTKACWINLKRRK